MIKYKSLCFILVFAENMKNFNAEFLTNGEAAFNEIMNALTHANKNINLECFMIKDDELGRNISNILIERARAGVKINVIFDAVGSWRLGKIFIDKLRASGVNICAFNPLSFSKNIIHRDHRKIITIDGKTGFLGGLNIGSEFKKWRDTHLKISGQPAKELEKIFLNMWDDNNKYKLINSHANDSPVEFEILTSGNGKNFRAIADKYINIISNAKKRIWITTPYFMPDKKFLESLFTASERGVDIKLIIPAQSNHILASWASHSYIDCLLDNNIRVFTYNNKFIHAKTLTVDSFIASVGSANIDRLSFEINHEVQAFIYSAEMSQKLEKIFIDDLNFCIEQLPDKRKKRPLTFIQKIQEKIGQLLAPIL